VELVASLADVGDVGEGLAFLFKFEVLGFRGGVFVAGSCAVHL